MKKPIDQTEMIRIEKLLFGKPPFKPKEDGVTFAQMKKWLNLMGGPNMVIYTKAIARLMQEKIAMNVPIKQALEETRAELNIEAHIYNSYLEALSHNWEHGVELSEVLQGLEDRKN